MKNKMRFPIIFLNIPFVPIRKKGKLPGKCHQYSYELEYGSDTGCIFKIVSNIKRHETIEKLESSKKSFFNLHLVLSNFKNKLSKKVLMF